MYTVSKGPTQIIEKTRRGISQKLDSIDLLHTMTTKNRGGGARYNSGEASGGGQGPHGGRIRPNYSMLNNAPQMPVFNNMSGQSPGTTSRRYHHRASQEKVTPQQEEIIKYVSSKWIRVEKELKESKDNSSKVTYYQESESNPRLRDFEPFDLEGWWGQRLYRNLTEGAATVAAVGTAGGGSGGGGSGVGVGGGH